jgi:hypothetical protein
LSVEAVHESVKEEAVRPEAARLVGVVGFTVSLVPVESRRLSMMP